MCHCTVGGADGIIDSLGDKYLEVYIYTAVLCT